MRTNGLAAFAAVLCLMASACASTTEQKRLVAPRGGEYITNGKSSRLVAKMNELDDYSVDTGYVHAPERKTKKARNRD